MGRFERWTENESCSSLSCFLPGVLAAAWILASATGGSGENIGPADRILVEKAARRLTLLRGGETLRSYRIALGANPVGRKEQQGDERTPEGRRSVSQIVSRKFGRALRVSYPNAEDAERAAAGGVPPGGEILIHAPAEGYRWLGRLHRWVDWTERCIAPSSPSA